MLAKRRRTECVQTGHRVGGHVARWARCGRTPICTIDGENQSFRSGLKPLPLSAKQTRRPVVPDKSGWKLTDHLARVSGIGRSRTAGPDVVADPPSRHLFHHRRKDAPGVKKGATVRAWLPFPQSYRQQSRVYLVSTSPPDGKVAPEGTLSVAFF